MPNKIVTLAGYSGVGKSKIARTLASETGLRLISVSGVMAQQAREENFRSLESYVMMKGVSSAFEHARGALLPEVALVAENQGVVIDGMYDRKFLDALRSDFKREDLIVVGLEAGILPRVRRMHARGASVLMGLAGDIAKINAGIREVMRDADIVIDARKTLPLTIQDCMERLAPLLKD